MMRACSTVVTIILLGALPVAVQAQVFSEAPGATKGEIFAGDGQSLYGTFGLDAASNPNSSYSIYRKFQGGNNFPEPLEIHEAKNVPNNASIMEWSGLHQGGPGNGDTGFLAPGVYIGNSKSTSSYEGQLVKFGPVIDGESSTGVVDAATDSEGRRDWDVRFGFLEDPDNFIDIRDPNNGSWDLWDGNWGSDGVMFHFGIGANIDEDPETGSTDVYVYPREDNTSFTAQSGEEFTAIGDQGQRDGMEFTGRRISSGEEIDTEFTARFSAGVSYEDFIEASWKMELNDPGGREVKLSAKIGNILYEGVFDPGTADDPVEPNPTNDFDTFYTDGFFDWENATPVMYIGASNGTSADAMAIQGFFIPGDLNSDGVADNGDVDRLNEFLGQADTTYSRGDIDQDGDTDDDDLAALRQIVGGAAPGDYNEDGVLDALDIDLQAVELKKDPANQNLAKFDHNNDAVVDVGLAGPDESKWGDRLIWIRTLRGTRVGDVDFNGVFDSGDLVLALQGSKYAVDAGNAEMATWVEGDWNGDMIFDSGDLVFAFQDGGYVAAAVPAIPEPSGLVLASLGLLALARRARRRVG